MQSLLNEAPTVYQEGAGHVRETEKDCLQPKNEARLDDAQVPFGSSLSGVLDEDMGSPVRNLNLVP